MEVEHESHRSSCTWQDAVNEQSNECCTTDGIHAFQQEHDVSSSNQDMPSTSPSQSAVPNLDGAVDLDNDQPRQVIDWLADIPTQGAAAGKTLRFRGMYLMLIGHFYPRGRFHVHRLGYPVDSDFKIKGTTLYKMRSAFDTEATYRITITERDEGNESRLVWSQNNTGQGHNADEYCNLIELGTDQLGHLMMFTVCRNGTYHWSLIRQIPGKIYTFEECVDLLGVPDWYREELEGFGNKTWTNGERPPEVWICNNLSLKAVTNKIRNIMRQ